MVDKLALGNATKCRTQEELLNKVDIVSLHVDGRPSNKNIFGKEQFDQMKEGAYFLNLARGHVVEIEALVNVLKSGKILGAGVDVYPVEPKTNNEPFTSELKELDNVILTPHIGGSTAEAQVHIGNYVPEKIIAYINNGSTYGSVNMPNLQLPSFQNSHRLLHIHENKSGILAEINNKLADTGCNIVGQYLKTNEEVGYVICDINQKYEGDVLKAFKEIEGTIKTRILY